MMPVKPDIGVEGLIKRYEDLLEIGRLVSWCTKRDFLIKACLDHIGQ
jgi:hypothetical protein